MEKPEYLTDEYLEYLDKLRDSGITNMFGTGPYLESQFTELNGAKANEIVSYWMDTFSERHN